MRLARSVALGGTALLAARLLDAAVLTPRRFRLPEVPLAVPGWPRELDGLRVALVGDVHAGSPWFDLARVEEVVRRVVAAQPDLVLMVGDHLADVRFGTHLDPEPVAQALGRLQDAGVPVVGVLGNHDWYAGGERVRAALEATGLCVLEEQAVPVLGGRLWVAGVGDLWERTPSVPAALADVPAGAPVLLLTHNPDVVADVPEHVQLVLAGHTHGGQVTAFGRPFHRISRVTANRWRRGWYAAERLYVTSGVGTSYIPLRTIVPEVPVLVLGAP